MGSSGSSGSDGGTTTPKPPVTSNPGGGITSIISTIVTWIQGGNPPTNTGGNSSGGSTSGGSNGGHHPGSNPWQPGGGQCSCTPESGNDTGQVPPEPSDISITLWRVCSEYRSNIPYPNFTFFEEAKHPILSFEAMSQTEYQSCYNTQQMIANLDMSNLPKTYCSSRSSSVVVQTVDLSGLNLLASQESTNMPWDLGAIETQLGSAWSRDVIAVTVCDDTVGDGKCSNKSPSSIISVLPPSFNLTQIPKNMEVDVWSGRHLLQDSNPDECDIQYSPLVLDLTGGGFVFTGPEDGVYFDINNTGTPVATGWTDPTMNNGFLVHNVSGMNGMLTGAQLFGTATVMRNGQRASNGFEALRDLDDNQDGKFSPADSQWSNVGVWIDRNHNGIMEPGELYSLDQLQILSFDLNYTSYIKNDRYGNQIRNGSTFQRRSRNQIFAMPIVDVWFNTLVNLP